MSIQSAKVIQKVVDNSSFIASGEGTSIGAVITASKGPIGTVVTVNDLTDLEQFGEVTKAHIGLVAAKKYLEKGTQLKLVRVATDSAATASVKLLSASDPVLSVKAKYVGTYGNELKAVVENPASGSATIKILEGTTLLEKHTISLDPASEIYVDNVEFEHAVVTDTTLGASASKALESGTFPLTGGNDGISGINGETYKGASSNGKVTGAQLFRSTGVEVSILATFGVTDKAYISELLTIADARKDCFVICDTPSGLSYSDAIDWANGEGTYSGEASITGWNCAVYWDWQYYTLNGEKILCPASAYVAANMYLSDQEYGCQYPVAGFKRGIVTSEGVPNNPDESTRDALVAGNVNPIADMGALGIAIMGNDTRNTGSSDLGSIHVARELIKIMKNVGKFTQQLYFELHNESTWNEWVDACTSFLEAEKTAEGLQWYSAKMDRTTMTDNDIANRKAIGVLQLQFYADAEVFELNYVVENSGSTME